MDLDVELLEITKDNVTEANFMASNFIDKEVKNRIFLNVIGAECVVNHLEKFGIDIADRSYVHSIKRIVECLDISDIILDNIRIDVRVVFDDNLIFVPKSHLKYDIVPDIYVVLKCDTNMERASLLGFFDPADINPKNCSENYYFLEEDKLLSPFDLVDYILSYEGKTSKKLSEKEMLRGRELSISLADHDITDEEFKELLQLLVSSNRLRSSVLEFDNFETLASRVAYALQVKQPKGNNSSVVDISSFMDLDNSEDNAEDNDILLDEQTEDITDKKSEDLNGDNLLDDKVLSTGVAGAVAGAAMSAAGAAAIGAVEGVEAAAGAIENAVGMAADIAEGAADIIENVIPSEDFAAEKDATDLNTREIGDIQPVQEDNTVDNSENENVEKTQLNSTDINTETEKNNDIDITEAPSEKNTAFTNDNIFEFDDGSLDFSDFEEDMQEQSNVDFINNNNDDSKQGQLLSFEMNEEEQNNEANANTNENDSPDENAVDFENINETEAKDDLSDMGSNNIHEMEEFMTSENNIAENVSPEADEFSAANDLHDISEMPEDQNRSQEIENMESQSEEKDLNVVDFGDIVKTDEESEPLESALEDENDANLKDLESANYDSESETDNSVESVDSDEEPTDIKESENADSENSEVSFEISDDLENLEAVASIEQNIDVDFSENEAFVQDLVNEKNSVKENSVIISDKNLTPGEIFIDINMSNTSSQMYTENENLAELYNDSPLNDDSGLNNDVRVVSEQSKSIPLAVGIGGIALVLLVMGIITFSAYKFMNPADKDTKITDIPKNSTEDTLGTDVPRTPNMDNNGEVITRDNITGAIPGDETVDQNPNNQMIIKTSESNISVHKKITATSFISISKLSWEVPDYIAYDNNFKQYFQSSGKSLKAALSSDILLATDYAYSDMLKVSILFDRSGEFKDAKILLSSGSTQIDNIVLQSVNQTLRVLKAPNSLGNDQSTTVILKIYL